MTSPVFYNCDRCPAYCCSYPRITVNRRDLKRLARHLAVDEETARDKFTKRGEEPGERVMRHQRDDIFGSVCRFLDVETRRCTIYEARPEICRQYPGTPRCGYYDFLSFERRTQDDPDFVPLSDLVGRPRRD